MPCRPSAPRRGHRSRGNSLVRSIASARGAVSPWAKPAPVSRTMSAVSPRSKLSDGKLNCAMAAPSEQKQGGDTEEGEEADRVDGRGDEHAGCDRRGEAQPLEAPREG